MTQKLLRSLPSVDELLRSKRLKGLMDSVDHALVADTVRRVLDELRAEIRGGAVAEVNPERIAEATEQRIRRILEPRLRRVINATGTVLHTNLGRAVLSSEALDAILLAGSGPVNLEYDLSQGARGERDSLVEDLLMRLTGAEAACVVNNNAAAVLIVLNTLADGREVVISRGELIEIGGSFRLPEIIAKSGCVLKEVGTTNRTHSRDYVDAIGPETALIFKAHTSNYRVVGFTAGVELGALVEIAASHGGLPVVEDLGSGSLVDLSVYGMEKEPMVRERVEAGAAVVTFSGDKLLGGPQAGLIVGTKAVIEKIRKNPLKRALRVDKLTLAALEATLKLYLLDPHSLASRLPVLRFLTRGDEELGRLADEAAKLLEDRLGSGYTVKVEKGVSVVGSGSLPAHRLTTMLVIVTHESKSAREVSMVFLQNTTPIAGRIKDERFMLDMRTVERAVDCVPETVGDNVRTSR